MIQKNMINPLFPYKYETHCHTSEASACSESTAAEMVDSYYKAGYRGLIITDHFFNGNSAIDASLPWKERVSQFCRGYENGLEAARGLDLDVFFGWEYGYHGTEFLTYGLDKQFLLDNPDILDWPLDFYFDRVHEAGGFLTHAHPFRERFYIKKIRLYGNKVDAIEVINSGNDELVFNDRAYEYARKNNLPKTAGSDSHNAQILSGEGTYFNKRLTSIHDFIHAVKNGKSHVDLSKPASLFSLF